jgi:hypothetical protein
MIAFMTGVIGDTTFEETSKALQEETQALLQPLLDGMNLEGSYTMKKACYNKALVNPDDRTCEHGAMWSEEAQRIMGGDLSSLHADVDTDDNFHQV